jgi:chemotaxis protein CheX
MDVNLINPFLDGTVSVLKTMAFVEPKAGKPFWKRNENAIGDVTGIIGMTGAAKGSLALSFSEECILKIVSNMLGEEYTSINGDIRDAVGEITNMISGAARQDLEKLGYMVTAAIPTIISGNGHQISHVLGGPSIVIPFEVEGASFVVDVCLTDQES